MRLLLALSLAALLLGCQGGIPDSRPVCGKVIGKEHKPAHTEYEYGYHWDYAKGQMAWGWSWQSYSERWDLTYSGENRAGQIVTSTVSVPRATWDQFNAGEIYCPGQTKKGDRWPTTSKAE
jgi:hypothetical protein